MQKFYFFSLCVALCLCVLNASAGSLVIIEPYVGVAKTTGTHKVNFYDTSSDTLKMDAEALQGFAGLRLGFFRDGIWISADGNASFSHEIQSKENQVGTFTWNGDDINKEKFDASRYNAGVIIGFRSRFTIWGAYYPYSVMHINKGSQTNLIHTGDIFKGTAYGGGLGFMLYPNLWIAAEYRATTYEKDSIKSTQNTSTGADQDFELTDVLVSASFPLEF
jgi:hypothetical protein